ncbi:MAG: hypothetical protein CME59_08485 [Halioglobus sp.]|nr:hypothetical protein [Halioglobus sp.]|tara:strand:+ start:2778 stop:3818 length:1041 start_codon:yes stop_codon:yes gene_type:complete
MTYRKRPAATATLLACLALVPLNAAAGEAAATDEIVLTDGSRILGRVIGSRDGELSVETDFAGTLTIPLDKIESLSATTPATLLLADETVISEQPVAIEDGELVLAEPAQTLPVETLSVLNPEPWELGQGYKWTGLVNLALVMERGNTDTDELDYKLETAWRSVDDRYRLNARGENDENSGTKTADNWRVSAQWDYFLTDPNYWGLLAQAEKDKFQDLDLRWLAGPYYGRQFFAAPAFTLSGEFGASYVEEDFKLAEDQEYGAANWQIDLSSNYLGGDSRLYMQQFGLWNLEDTSDVVVNTTLGLGFPLLFGFEAAAEILWEYDSGAVDNVDEMDETYSLRIGYTW